MPCYLNLIFDLLVSCFAVLNLNIVGIIIVDNIKKKSLHLRRGHTLFDDFPHADFPSFNTLNVFYYDIACD